MIVEKYKAEYASEVMETIPYGYIDKTICGCGLTTVALENNINTIIAVPSIYLINNKCEQYPNVRSNYEIFGVWGDVTDKQLNDYLLRSTVVKLMVTYNSLHRVEHLIPKCHLIIDESNEILVETKQFPKEIDYLFSIGEKFKDTISFISATPTPLEYLPKWVSTIPQIKIEWEDTIIAKPIILDRTYPYKALREEILKPLNKQNTLSIGGKTFSKIIVFINSVEQIIKIIKESEISKEDCNIICGDNLKNDVKISGINRYSIKEEIPKFLFITKSGFAGIDLNDIDAMTVVVSNTNKKWQMIDVKTDLKQAISRQRNKNNPNYGTYIYIYNQSIFNKSEEELILELDEIYKNLENGIANWKWGRDNGKEWKGYENDKDFKQYTLIRDGEYIINENAFLADKYFILETRKQYTNGFEIKKGLNDVVEVEVPEKVKELNFSSLVDYFNENHINGRIDWSLVGGKQEWKDLIDKCYSLYGVVYKNYTYCKQMNELFGNAFEILKINIKEVLKKGEYPIQEIKDTLNSLYKKHNIKRSAKITDLNDIITYKQIRVNNKRLIKIW